MIEKKVAPVPAASGAGIGALIWALVTFVPSFRAAVPEPVAAALPFALGWLGHVIAAYQAPHTHRPDLALPAPESLPPLPPAGPPA